jgi:hypothetical protein
MAEVAKRPYYAFGEFSYRSFVKRTKLGLDCGRRYPVN